MSGISGISTNDTSLLNILAQIAAQNGDTSVTSLADADPLLAVGTDSQTGTTIADTANLSILQEAIRKSVSSAIAEAEKSGNTSDLKKVIQNAVEQALKDNGIDVEKLKEQFAAAAGHIGHKHHKHKAQTDSSEQTSDTNSTYNDTDITNNNTQSTNSAGNQATPQIDSKTGDLLALLWSSQNDNQNLTGYLFDTGQ